MGYCKAMRTPEQKAKHAERERQRRAEHPDRYAEYGRRQRAAVAADPERAARRREYQRQYQAEYRSAHPEQRSAIRRRSEMVKRVGITPERYDEMVAEREGRCDICGKAPEKRLCIACATSAASNRKNGVIVAWGKPLPGYPLP